MPGIRSFTNNLKISPPVLSTRRLLFLYIILTVSFYDAFSREYFQQEVNYNIIVSLNDRSHELTAFETIEYINNSPDLLRTTKRLDYKMVRIKNNQLLIKNNGELLSPLVIAGTKEDSIFFERWIDGFAGKKWIPLPDGDYTEIKIDTGHEMPEIFRIKSGYLEYFRNLCSIPGFQKY